MEVSAALAHRAAAAADDPLAQRALEAALSAVVGRCRLTLSNPC